MNKAALLDFFRWMVSLTKEDERIHFFLASSEQFFMEWLELNVVSPTEITVIGDLPKNEALKYFESLHPPQDIDFLKLFELTGKFLFIY